MECPYRQQPVRPLPRLRVNRRELAPMETLERHLTRVTVPSSSAAHCREAAGSARLCERIMRDPDRPAVARVLVGKPPRWWQPTEGCGAAVASPTASTRRRLNPARFCGRYPPPVVRNTGVRPVRLAAVRLCERRMWVATAVYAVASLALLVAASALDGNLGNTPLGSLAMTLMGLTPRMRS